MTDHVSELRLVVTAPDYDAALAFYRDELGLPEEAVFASDGGRVTILAAGRATLELADPAHAAFVDQVEVGHRVAGHVRVAFEVPDTAAVTDRLARAGVPVLAPPMRTPWSSLNARLDAPGGLQVTLFSDIAGEPAPRGEDEITAGRVGAPDRIDAPVLLAEADPSWATTAAALMADVKGVLGDRVLLLEHVGSTSVPGLAAKPLIDLVLAVRDPADEASYVGALEQLGYVLRVREPDWHQHRMLRLAEPAVNLHVFGLGAEEIDRMLLFRDHLRADPDDLAFYERTKTGLARRTWEFVQQYADAKTDVVEQIVARAVRRDARALMGAYVLVTGDGVPSTELARRLAQRLELPLLATALVEDAAAAAGSPVDRDTAAAVVLALAAAAPAAVLSGDWDGVALRAVLPGRVVDALELPGGASDLDLLARAVRQQARSGGG